MQNTDKLFILTKEILTRKFIFAQGNYMQISETIPFP